MAKLTPFGASLLSCLGVSLAVGMMVAGSPTVALAQGGDAGVLYACVHKDRWDGEVHGYIRIVLPSEQCRRDEARFGLNVGAPGGGGDGAFGAIRGQVLLCQGAGSDPVPVAGSFAGIAGQSFAAFTNGTGEFELSRVPPGTYELVVGVPVLSEVTIVSNVQVSAGQTTDVDPTVTVVCFPD
jgi:hypothetical protein